MFIQHRMAGRKMKRYPHKLSAREEILQKLRKSPPAELTERPDLDNPVFYQITDPPEIAFKKNLELVSGKV